VRFFFDNTLPRRLARAMHELLEKEHQVVHLQDKFKPDTPDEHWFEVLGREGNWIVVSSDVRITRSVHTQRAWLDSKLISFFLKSWADKPIWIQAAQLCRWWPDIMKQAATAPAGAGFLVPFNHSPKNMERLRLTKSP
jgi:hypothetical protein